MTTFRLRRVAAADAAPLGRQHLDDATLRLAGQIVERVRVGGWPALQAEILRFGDVTPSVPLVCEGEALQAALNEVAPETRKVLERTAARIVTFANAQRAQLTDGLVDIAGGQAGWTYAPVERAGCYAPGGRFPLPSSVLMTALTARAAGVEHIIVASPRPTLATRAAAALAGVDMLLSAGGAHAIASLAFGAGPLPACDVVVGPGNRWVTAAKQLVSGFVRIDMLAGPSELVVLADDAADSTWVAADLLAQAEHDDDAVPVLVTCHAELVNNVERELVSQIADLATSTTAAAALRHGFAVVVQSADEAVQVCDRLAPEHLALHVRNPAVYAARLRHYGALFLGGGSAEVLGDYGAGPNHVLPTGGTARGRGGLSVLDFLRVRTWLEVKPGAGAESLLADARAMAELEGLPGHARSAALRSARGA